MVVPRISGVRSKLELGHIRATVDFVFCSDLTFFINICENVLLIWEMGNDRGVAAFTGERTD